MAQKKKSLFVYSPQHYVLGSGEAAFTFHYHAVKAPLKGKGGREGWRERERERESSATEAP